MLQENNHETEARVQRDIVDACVSHYEVFGVAHSALKQASSYGSTHSSEIDTRLSKSLALLDNMSNRVLANSSDWRAKRQVAANSLSQSFRLVELYEAPQTLEACIASDAYHEALLVIEHIRTMHDEFPESAIISAISERVDQVLTDCLTNLIFPRLSQPISLTVCVKLMTFLRRLGVPDLEIRRLFLCRKLESLELVLTETAKAQSPYSVLSKAISAFKVHLSEIVLRFEACFPLTDDEYVAELQSWVLDRVSAFSSVFAKQLHYINSGAELASLANQLEHLSPSLGQVSADFTPLLVPIIIKRAEELFTTQLRLANETYLAAMGTQVWSHASSTTQKSPVDGGVPMQLLQFLPLAYIANGILNACNEIRKCAFGALGVTCESHIDRLLTTVALEIENLLRNSFLSSTEQRNLTEFKGLFGTVLVPHIEMCLKKVFPNLQGSILLSTHRYL